MQLLITGGRGSLSRVMVQEVLRRGHRVHLFGVPNGGLRPDRRLVLHSDAAAPWSDVDLRSIDAVIHLEGPAPSAELSVERLDNYLVRTQRLAEQAVAAGVPLFVTISSLIDYSGDPPHPFVAHKMQTEEIIREFAPQHVIFRAGWVIGPQDLLVAPLVKHLRAGRIVQIPKDDAVIQMLLQQELAHVIAAATEQRNEVSRIYDAASMRPVALSEFLRRIAWMLGVPHLVVSEPTEDASIPFTNAQLDLLKRGLSGNPAAFSRDFRLPIRSVEHVVRELVRTMVHAGAPDLALPRSFSTNIAHKSLTKRRKLV